MTGPEHHPDRPGIDGVWLRHRLVAVAAAIASTEDQVAETLERMALAMPEDAVRLRAHAAHARKCATVERDRAARFTRLAATYRFPGFTRPDDQGWACGDMPSKMGG